MSEFRAAIAGTGFMAKTHAEALKRLCIEVTGFSGETVEDGLRAARKFDCVRPYRDFEEMIADPDVQVVHICTPNYLHYPMVKAAMQAGKHVYCEKPLAVSRAQAGALCQLERELGVVGAVNYNLRFYPLVHEARARIAAGEIGAPRIIHGHYLQDWLLYGSDWNWRLDSEEGGALRAVADIGTHWFDMLTWLTGLKITEVMADLSNFHPVRKKPRVTGETFSSGAGETNDVAVNTEDCAMIILKFENGAVGTLIASQISAGHKNRLYWEVNGDGASLAWQQESPNELWIGQRDGPNQTLIKDPGLASAYAGGLMGYPGGHAEGYPDTFVQVFRKYYGYLSAGDFSAERSFATFADGLYESRLCEAVLQSHQERRWVGVGDE